MKVLCFYTTSFAYTLGEQNHDCAEGQNFASFSDAVVAFIHAEESDEKLDIASREKKLVNHLKWVARKNNATNLVLHSFAHLSLSKASLPFTRELFNAAQARLKNGGYQVSQTPFGYFLNIDMQAPGFSMARIWAEL